MKMSSITAQSKPGREVLCHLASSSPEAPTGQRAIGRLHCSRRGHTVGLHQFRATADLLVGEIVGDNCARGFAKAVAGAPERDETDEIAAFCRQGSFLVDSA